MNGSSLRIDYSKSLALISLMSICFFGSSSIVFVFTSCSSSSHASWYSTRIISFDDGLSFLVLMISGHSSLALALLFEYEMGKDFMMKSDICWRCYWSHSSCHTVK